MADPILKWAGGKRQLLPQIYQRFPKEYTNFYEPFIGGGALTFDLEPRNATINDTNPRLINFYLQIKKNHEKVIELSKTYQHPNSLPDPDREFHDFNRKGKIIKNYYYQQREIFNNRPNMDKIDLIEEAALLLYLNRTCYNGLYRENSSGGFNVPIGSYKKPDWIRESQVRIAHNILKNVKIRNKDFNFIINEAKDGDLVYFDPPYEPMSSTASFNDYSAEGFNMDDQKRLLKLAQSLSEKGVFIIMSNSGIMYELYKEFGFMVEKVPATRAINSNAKKRGQVEEILATNVKINIKKIQKQNPKIDPKTKQLKIVDYFSS